MTAFCGEIDGGLHRLAIRVYYEDTDAGGVVYHARYLNFAERARTELLRALGIEQSQLRRRFGMVFAVRDCALEFRRPARFDDLLEVRSCLIEMSGASLRAVQSIWRGGELLVDVKVRVAALGDSGRPTRIPEPVRAALGPYIIQNIIQPRSQD